MAGCGCTNGCGCSVIAADDTIVVTTAGGGSIFKVAALPLIREIEDTDCVDLDVDLDGVLTVRPILADAATEDASVQLSCSPTGITGDVVIDPASTAPISLTPNGLRIDLPPPEDVFTGGAPGDLKPTARLRNEPGWLDADGSQVSRNTFPQAWDAVSLVTELGVRVAGSAQITDAPTRGLAPGMPAEIEGFDAGIVVVSIDAVNAFTVDSAALSSGTDTTVRVYPYGNGDGGTTFNLPLVDPDGYVKQRAAGEGLGRPSGGNSTTIAIGNMPAHEHAGSTAVDVGHDHGAGAVTDVSVSTEVSMDNAGGHAHSAGSAGDSQFVTVVNGVEFPGAFRYAAEVASGPGTIRLPTQPFDADVGPGEDIRREQNVRAETNPTGTHVHPLSASSTALAATSVDVSPGAANIALDIAEEGGGAPLDNRPLSRAFRWVVKV